MKNQRHVEGDPPLTHHGEVTESWWEGGGVKSGNCRSDGFMLNFFRVKRTATNYCENPWKWGSCSTGGKGTG